MLFQRLSMPILCVLALSSFAPSEAQPDADTSCDKKTGLCWLRVKSGSQGPSVEGLQRLLATKGYKLSPSGTYNSQTARAIRNFQTQRKLQVDGIAGFQTWEALVPTLRKGNKGASVKILQTLLWNRNYATTRDGIFGPATERQVQKLQKDIAITEVTGHANPTVWCFLLGGHIDGE